MSGQTCLLCNAPDDGIICHACDKNPRAWPAVLAWLDEAEVGSPAASRKLEALRELVRRPGPLPKAGVKVGDLKLRQEGK